jgi:hypothetical protein
MAFLFGNFGKGFCKRLEISGKSIFESEHQWFLEGKFLENIRFLFFRVNKKCSKKTSARLNEKIRVVPRGKTLEQQGGPRKICCEAF